MIHLLVIAIIFLYMMIGGFIGGRWYKWRKAECKSCNNRGWTCYSDHIAPAVFVGGGWPLVGPVVGGVLLGFRDPKVERMQAKIDAMERELNIR